MNRSPSAESADASAPDPRVKLTQAVDSLRPLVHDIAVSLYEHPETGLNEVFASGKLTAILESYGFSVDRDLAGMPTSFAAKIGSGRPCIGFMAEYDALPGIGHGCGHNLMAACAMAAGIACSRVLGEPPASATWMVIGTPAEETVGGKVAMAQAGLFDHVDAAFIAHPGQRNSVGGGVGWASHPLEITFHGKPSHAGGNPQEGINALDACVEAYIAIRSLRNSLRDEVRIAGIITHGGDAQNIIPEKAAMKFTLRSTDSRYLEENVIPRVKRCAEAAAMSVGAAVEFRHHEPLFRETLGYPVLRDIARRSFEYLGQEVPPVEGGGGGVTDVGNVTWVTPCIQIGFGIGDARGHSREMADATVTPRAIDATLVAATVMALSALELLEKPEMLSQAKAHLKDSLKAARCPG